MTASCSSRSRWTLFEFAATAVARTRATTAGAGTRERAQGGDGAEGPINTMTSGVEAAGGGGGEGEGSTPAAILTAGGVGALFVNVCWESWR